MWTAVTSQSDADHLLDVMRGFHDSCIREAHVWGGYFVAENRSMACPDTPDLRCRLLIQSQFSSVSAVELVFDGVSHLCLTAPEGYDRIILKVALRVEKDRIFWSPDRNVQEPGPESQFDTVILSKRLWWKELGNALGPALRYADIDSLPSASAP